MQTHFSLSALADPDMAQSEKILRACVHCGFCTATCPTYLLTGDELDSPRGRIYLIKEMLENGRPADARTAHHIDRCLSCLSCMTTCPSGVHYMRLVDHARAHIEKTYARPLARARHARRARLSSCRARRCFAPHSRAARFARPVARSAGRLRGLLALAPRVLPRAVLRRSPASVCGGRPPQNARRATQRLRADRARHAINEATIRLLTRHGVEVVVARGAGCCGALRASSRQGRAIARMRERNIEAWTREIEAGGLDHIVVNTSGCGTSVKDYGYHVSQRSDSRGKGRAYSPAMTSRCRRER